MGLKRYPEAREALQSLLKTDPNQTDALFQLGVVALAENKNQDALEDEDLVRYARGLHLEVPRFAKAMQEHDYAERVREDVRAGFVSPATARARHGGGAPDGVDQPRQIVERGTPAQHHGARLAALSTGAQYALRGLLRRGDGRLVAGLPPLALRGAAPGGARGCGVGSADRRNGRRPGVSRRCSSDEMRLCWWKCPSRARPSFCNALR